MTTQEVRPTRKVGKAAMRSLQSALPTLADGKRYDDDKAWLRDHKEEVLRDHKDEWVAVHREKIVGHSRDLHDLVRDLRRRRVDMTTVVIEYVTDREVTMLL